MPLSKEDLDARILIQIHNNKNSHNIDSLTGLYNKAYFYLKLKTLMPTNMNLSLVMIDIDLFKKKNDLYGHLEGDKAIKAFAEVVQSAIRTDDILARFGGDEFILLLPNANIEQAGDVVQRIQRKIEINKASVASFGITSHKFDDSIEDFINRADKALYLAKYQGRNQVVTILD
jgi:diguanylate cyclase (GGDEF)-like protein